MSDIGRRLEVAFESVAPRMAGLPFVNPALKVEAVGFGAWEGQWLGVLVTPWSMNIVLLPGAGTWPTFAQGAERFVDLPAGRFRFIAAHDAELGEYHACSLFSPALEFPDHDTARATAAAALQALLDPATAKDEAAPPASVSRRDFLRGCRTDGSHADRG